MTVHKLQLSGRSYYVYIPTKWVKSNNLVKGSEVNVLANNDGVVIKPLIVEGKRLMRTSIELRSADPLLIRDLIMGLFTSGFNEFELRFINGLSKDLFNEIKGLINNLGLNMIELTDKSIKLNVNLSINDLWQFTYDIIYKALNIVRMISNGYDSELISHQVSSFYYYRLMIQRSIFRYQQSLDNLNIKPFEVNLYNTLAINLGRLMVHVNLVNDNAFINKVKEILEQLLIVYKKQGFDLLINLLGEINSLELSKSDVRSPSDYSKRRCFRFLEDILRALINNYLIGNSTR